ncbi:uncharacterized protein THITE_2120867 [Thermothielavioides terrestris NRRL 8126]|uniref:Uncharacterized protein n=1 Tax=Thermothielavioides terrestris (strain ATCC 38088 / NRRL 8126) TaxID=578455 RepID=G2RDU9_THETT|nr:uncharacterized protein THITE_2120867 [Thermothielavioides terrestris NRRL 8126]AEO70030.1 hypothetical protein THITE_2120867 [Thermothielavioides terrestris NRRL 8126]
MDGFFDNYRRLASPLLPVPAAPPPTPHHVFYAASPVFMMPAHYATSLFQPAPSPVPLPLSQAGFPVRPSCGRQFRMADSSTEDQQEREGEEERGEDTGDDCGSTRTRTTRSAVRAGARETSSTMEDERELPDGLGLSTDSCSAEGSDEGARYPRYSRRVQSKSEPAALAVRSLSGSGSGS